MLYRINRCSQHSFLKLYFLWWHWSVEFYSLKLIFFYWHLMHSNCLDICGNTENVWGSFRMFTVALTSIHEMCQTVFSLRWWIRNKPSRGSLTVQFISKWPGIWISHSYKWLSFFSVVFFFKQKSFYFT